MFVDGRNCAAAVSWNSRGGGTDILTPSRGELINFLPTLDCFLVIICVSIVTGEKNAAFEMGACGLKLV